MLDPGRVITLFSLLVDELTDLIVADLETDIRTWIDNWNRDPRPYIWTKTAEQILESIGVSCQRLLKMTNDSTH